MMKYEERTPKIFLTVVFLTLIFSLSGLIISNYRKNSDTKVESIAVKKDEPTEVQPPVEKPQEPELRIKEAVTLLVPYTVQAPFANWAVHQESCEEAAALMYHYFLLGQTSFEGSSIIPQQGASDEMVKMKKWQEDHFGKEPDLTIEQEGKFIKEYYGHEYEIFKNITKEDIKRELSNDNPVIVPVMTHSLGNPHYAARDSYHVLLVKGYNSEGVIANDPGVREGESYFYSWDVLFTAIDAQTPKMGQGREMAVIK